MKNIVIGSRLPALDIIKGSKVNKRNELRSSSVCFVLAYFILSTITQPNYYLLKLKLTWVTAWRDKNRLGRKVATHRKLTDFLIINIEVNPDHLLIKKGRCCSSNETGSRVVFLK